MLLSMMHSEEMRGVDRIYANDTGFWKHSFEILI